MTRRIAILTHSTNPRGGVVHAMQLAEALHARGEAVTLLAPALAGHDFPRPLTCPRMLIPARLVTRTVSMVKTRIVEIASFLSAPGAPRFDLLHAQDPISANALADLAAIGCISGFARTIHHLDAFADPELAAWQDRAVRAADTLFCVSRVWQQTILATYGRTAAIVGNGVDRQRFTRQPGPRDTALRAELAPGPGPLLVALGGIEARKNVLTVLEAFLGLRLHRPDARLLIAGGATLLDHAGTEHAFMARVAASGAGGSIVVAGVVADEDMPALYRIADALLSVSRAEGFGLCAIEAMACGTPTVVSAIPPFTEHLRSDEVLWADPDDAGSIMVAMQAALDPITSEKLRSAGPRAAARFDWQAVATAHAGLYDAASADFSFHRSGAAVDA